MNNHVPDLEYQGYVLQTLVKCHGIEAIDAERLIKESSFLRILSQMPDYVYQRSPSYWADNIIAEAANRTY